MAHLPSGLVVLWLTLLPQLALSLTSLPRGINLNRAAPAGTNVQSQIRARAEAALNRALGDGVKLCEFEFPPLLGTKTLYEDFDNVQVLDANQDWTVEFALPFSGRLDKRCWVVFPDRKEVELAREAWPGAVYQRATLVSLGAALNHVLPRDADGTLPATAAGGAAVGGFFGAMSKLTGLLGEGADTLVFGDAAAEEAWSDACDPAGLVLCVQPGEGGPVEDWVNVEKLYEASVAAAAAAPPPAADADAAETAKFPADRAGAGGPTLVVVNGALDKIRNGYYPKIFFPEIAGVMERFYSRMEPVYYLKPLVGGGVGGWLHRAYPEPWQVVLNTEDGDEVVAALDERPTFSDALAMIQKASVAAR